ncbi:MAG: UDP-N-acetylenolpyruvoylglucosamine reductase [Patescibacteria group bacterium]|nr:MAG: UDP-N-acetylenolpyruvoylglucosamine reductase [Patescibacteria group bacterium]
MKIHTNLPLSNITHYRIGGVAKKVLEITSREDLLEAVKLVQRHNLQNVYILGLGSNILLPDKSIDGVILWMRGRSEFSIHHFSEVDAFAGDLLDDLINFTFSHQLVGLEWAGGLPSTIGGAIRGNAGAFGYEIKDIIKSVEYIDITDKDLNIRTLLQKECQFAYRDSIFKHNPSWVIVSGTFKLKLASQEELKTAKEIYEKNILYRNTHHPVEYPSCGSVFKNITRLEEVEKILNVWPDIKDLSQKKWHNKIAMGYVINRLGFSGKRVGGAKVSEKHANYIINTGNATSQDVLTLIRGIQQKFQKTFGFVPDPEVMIVNSKVIDKK